MAFGDLNKRDLDRWIEGTRYDPLYGASWESDEEEDEGIECAGCDKLIREDDDDIMRYNGTWLCGRCYANTDEGALFMKANEAWDEQHETRISDGAGD